MTWHYNHCSACTYNNCDLKSSDTSSSHLASQGDADHQDQVRGEDGGGVQGATLVTVQEGQAGDEHARDNHEACLPVGSWKLINIKIKLLD